MRERKTVPLPVEALDDSNLSPSEVVILAQILRFQSRIDRFTVNWLDQFLNLSKNTIRKGLLILAASGYLTTLPGNKGWIFNEIKICVPEDQNLNSESSESDFLKFKNCASEKEEESTKEEDKDKDKDKRNIGNIYNNNSLKVKENDKEKEIKEKEKVSQEIDEIPLPEKSTEPEKPERFTSEYREIIAYLNEKTGKRFSATSRVNQGHMSARLKEGFTVEDFKRVIDVKCFQWKDDPKMAKFLRPETLFGTKFDRYLNEEFKVTRKGLNGFEYVVTDEPSELDAIF